MNIVEKERILQKMEKEELIDLIIEYDNYIIEKCDENMGNTPVCLFEFYYNEYQEIKKENE